MTAARVYTTMESPLGDVLLTGEESASAPGGTALASVSLPEQKGGVLVADGWLRSATAFGEIERQLERYFAGELTDFALHYARGGTEFQQRVWQELDRIPYGTTVTYGEIARRMGASRIAVRAVGSAIGRNPLLVVRPCHRVIGSDGALHGYAAGLERKEHLLRLEGALVA
ncbi:methylated-DNA--[protein]-cysteine S-methyltransferase [Streptomyces sp. NPDC059256]|uniref:methylated-DNA--[protein]-cysteine S-methyltransferase n=1 Tax=Streptomyces sp. NPDC059256 TaxID=3346794 RepID=UPI0036C7DE0C